jgi:hypothetical protein
MPIPVTREFNTASWPVLNKIAINAKIINIVPKVKPTPDTIEEKTDERKLLKY